MNAFVQPGVRAFAPGFSEPAHDAQAVFRAAMQALARPGTTVSCPTALNPPAPLSPVAAALALTLADFEVTLWLDGALAAAPDVARYLTFHTGARIVADPGQANFALIADVAAMPPFAIFAQGTLDYPDRSTTVIMQVDGFGAGYRFDGPGIRHPVSFSPVPEPRDFAAQFAENRARFPLGVDLVFAGPQALGALPRSVRWIGDR